MNADGTVSRDWGRLVHLTVDLPTVEYATHIVFRKQAVATRKGNA